MSALGQQGGTTLARPLVAGADAGKEVLLVRKRILVADTETVVLKRYQECLAEHGFKVAIATNGLDCVAQMRCFRPHLLVLDPWLPWGGGEGGLAMMYEDPQVPLVPVIAMSGR